MPNTDMTWNNTGIYDYTFVTTGYTAGTWESVVTAIKRKTPNIIITEIKNKQKISHQDLAKICEVTPQAITFHCQRLEKTGIISSIKVGRQKFYTISEQIIPLMKYIKFD